MISFWITVKEEDVDCYVQSLILPEYMSHLRRQPFLLSEQAFNSNGRQPLAITYVGERRVEELLLLPEVHALPLLQSFAPFLKIETLSVSAIGPVWSWDKNGFNQREENSLLKKTFEPDTSDRNPINHFYYSADDQCSSALNKKQTIRSENLSNYFENNETFRLFFESDIAFFRAEPQINSSPFDAYASISREEMFISKQIFQEFFTCILQKILLPEYPPFQKNDVKIENVNGGFAFSIGTINGIYLLENDTFFSNLLTFCNLTKTLDSLKSYVFFDFDSSQIRFEEKGIYFSLTDKQSL